MHTVHLGMKKDTKCLKESNNERAFVGAHVRPFVYLIGDHDEECGPKSNVHQKKFDLERILNTPEGHQDQKWHGNNTRVSTDFNKIMFGHGLRIKMVFAERANENTPELGFGCAPGVACPMNDSGKEIRQKKRNNKS